MISYLQWLNWRFAVWAMPLFLIATGIASSSFEPDDAGDLYQISVFLGVCAGAFAGAFAGGNGIKALWSWRHRSVVYYVLSLPVKRRIVVLAHAGTTALIAVLGNAVVLGFVIAMTRLEGIELAGGTLVLGILLSQANAVAVAFGLMTLATLLPTFWLLFAALVFTVGYARAALVFAPDVAGQAIPWKGMGLAVAIVAIGLFLMLRFARRKDY